MPRTSPSTILSLGLLTAGTAALIAATHRKIRDESLGIAIGSIVSALIISTRRKSSDESPATDPGDPNIIRPNFILDAETDAVPRINIAVSRDIANADVEYFINQITLAADENPTIEFRLHVLDVLPVPPLTSPTGIGFMAFYTEGEPMPFSSKMAGDFDDLLIEAVYFAQTGTTP